MSMIKSIATTVYSWARKVAAPLPMSAATESSSNNVHRSGYTMRVRVKKSSDALFWYTQQIGKEFVVVSTDIDRFWVRELDEYHCLNFILKVDCVVVVRD
jgi:hypothetical protein